MKHRIVINIERNFLLSGDDENPNLIYVYSDDYDELLFCFQAKAGDNKATLEEKAIPMIKKWATNDLDEGGDNEVEFI